ncbi:MAG: PBSX family phage portal protein [Candidatus Nitrosomirales archaeon]
MEDNDVVTEVKLGVRHSPSPAASSDPFKTEYDEVKKFMGLSNNLKRRVNRQVNSKKAGTKQIEPDMVDGYTYLDCVMPPENIDNLAKLYDISPAHHSAVDAKVSSIFGLGWQLVESKRYKRMKESTRKESGLKRAEDLLKKSIDDVEDFLDNCNDRDSFEEVLRKIGIDYESTGNAYMEIGRDVTGKIGYLGHIPAQHMRVRRERDGFVQIYSNHVRYFRNFGEKNPNPVTTDANPNEIIHFKKYTPTNTYYGLPDIYSAKNSLAGNEFASRYNLDFFENQAIPRYAIIAKQSSLSPTSVNKLIEFFESGVRGQPHRTIFIPLAKDVDGAEIKFEQIDTGDKDGAFASFRADNNEDIFMAHRTPFTRAGVYAKGMTLAAARDADKVFKESVSKPEQEIFEKKFAKVIKEKTDVVVFRLNELALTDEDTQSKIDERDTRMGLVVPDEVRARRGQGPRPDGKGSEPWQANAQQAAEQKAQASQSRTRDANRSAGATDSAGQGRNEKGSGRSTP